MSAVQAQATDLASRHPDPDVRPRRPGLREPLHRGSTGTGTGVSKPGIETAWTEAWRVPRAFRTLLSRPGWATHPAGRFRQCRRFETTIVLETL